MAMDDLEEFLNLIGPENSPTENNPSDSSIQTNSSTKIVVLNNNLYNIKQVPIKEKESNGTKLLFFSESEKPKELVEGGLVFDSFMVDSIELSSAGFLPQPPKILSQSAKSYTKKVSAEQWEKITAKDLYEYFQVLYYLTYQKFYSISTTNQPRIFSMIKKGPLKKYGAKKLMSYIARFIDDYEAMSLPTARYPRPEFSSLAQDWIINKIEDRREKVEATTVTKIARGRYRQFEPPKDLDERHWAARLLATNGYLPDSRVDVEYIEEVAIPKWNKANKERAL